MADKSKLTVICRDNSNVRHGYEGVLIYVVEADPEDEVAVFKEIVKIREEEIDDMDPDDIELLFAFAGDIKTIVDWRE